MDKGAPALDCTGVLNAMADQCMPLQLAALSLPLKLWVGLPSLHTPVGEDSSLTDHLRKHMKRTSEESSTCHSFI